MTKIKMKNSGIEWIGEIPEDWEIIKCKFLVPKNIYYPIGDGDHGAIKPEMYVNEGIPYIRVQNLSWNGKINYEGMVYISEEIHNKNLKSELVLDDILIAKTGATIGKIGLITNDIKRANTTSSVGKITINKDLYDVKFIVYSFMSRYFKFQYEPDAYSKSAQPGFNIEDLINYFVIVPTLSVQNSISNYLDCKTQKIEQFIENKKKLISLLEEQKMSIISKAVTKGLDENVEMKHSGIEWIGEIPKAWDFQRLKMLSKIKRGASPRPIDDSKYFDDNGEFAWVRISDVSCSEKYLYETEQQLSELGSSLSVKQYPGDLFLSIAGSVGKPIIAKIKCCIHDGFVAFQNINKLLNQDFLFFILYSGLPYTGIGKEGTQLNLNIDTVGNIVITLPPIEEQKQIINYLDTETKKIDKAIEKIQKEISLIEEYKDSLIFHAVTGKMDIK